MKFHKNTIHIILFLLVSLIPGYSLSQTLTDTHELHDLQVNQQGIFKKIGGDPYIIFPEIEQQICSSNGVRFSIKFLNHLSKPLLLEVFWSTETLGFGEENKVFFTIHPEPEGNANTFIVPLDHIATFSQIRLDFPSYLDSDFIIEDYSIVSMAPPPNSGSVISSFRILNMDEALNPHIMVPYVLKSFKHGTLRLMEGWGFFGFWLFTILFLLTCIRIFSAQNKS